MDLAVVEAVALEDLGQARAERDDDPLFDERWGRGGRGDRRGRLGPERLGRAGRNDDPCEKDEGGEEGRAEDEGGGDPERSGPDHPFSAPPPGGAGAGRLSALALLFFGGFFTSRNMARAGPERTFMPKKTSRKYRV